MTMNTHWMQDEREILRALLAAYEGWFESLAGARFERFERNGEYCMLPWLRIITDRRTIETPLTHVSALEFCNDR